MRFFFHKGFSEQMGIFKFWTPCFVKQFVRKPNFPHRPGHVSSSIREEIFSQADQSTWNALLSFGRWFFQGAGAGYQEDGKRWVFPKNRWKTTQNGWFVMKNPIKMDDLKKHILPPKNQL